MDDSDSVQLVPNRVLDMVRMFLAPSTRGEHAVLILETKNQRLITKYRTVEKVAGASATANTPASHNDKRNVNPAKARRSRLRLEEFKRRKEEENQENQQETGIETVGDFSRNSCKLVVQLSKEENKAVETGPDSPIFQVDGQDAALLEDVSFSFKSEYGEEDICSSLEEMFPPFVAQLDSRVRLGRIAADHK